MTADLLGNIVMDILVLVINMISGLSPTKNSKHSG